MTRWPWDRTPQLISNHTYHFYLWLYLLCILFTLVYMSAALTKPPKWSPSFYYYQYFPICSTPKWLFLKYQLDHVIHALKLTSSTTLTKHREPSGIGLYSFPKPYPETYHITVLNKGLLNKWIYIWVRKEWGPRVWRQTLT